MKTCSSCGRVVADGDGLELKDGIFYCKSGGCQKRFLDGVVANQVIPDIQRSGGQVVGLSSLEKPDKVPATQVATSAPPMADSSSAEFNQQCEVCHTVQVEGNRYRFFYGKKTDKSLIGAVLAMRGTGDPPLIRERGSAWICRKCASMQVTLRWVLMVLLVLVSIGLIGAASMLPTASLVFTPLGLILLGIFVILLPRLGGKNDILEKKAIQLKRKELRRQGYDVFLTNKQFNKLR
jgi:hypothetical protein